MERAYAQLEYVFASNYEYRDYFIWLAISNTFTIVVAIAFWFKCAAAQPLSPILVLCSVGFLVWSIIFGDSTWIFNYTLGFLLAVWSWRRPNQSFQGTRRDKAVPRP